PRDTQGGPGQAVGHESGRSTLRAALPPLHYLRSHAVQPSSTPLLSFLYSATSKPVSRTTSVDTRHRVASLKIELTPAEFLCYDSGYVQIRSVLPAGESCGNPGR